MNSCAKNGGAPRSRFPAIGEKPEGGCSNTPPARRGLTVPFPHHSCVIAHGKATFLGKVAASSAPGRNHPLITEEAICRPVVVGWKDLVAESPGSCALDYQWLGPTADALCTCPKSMAIMATVGHTGAQCPENKRQSDA